MKSADMLVVKQLRLSTSPSMMLVGVTKSLCSLFQEMESCLSMVFDSPSRRKIALMLAMIACLKRPVSAMSR